ncbi:MAG: ATP-binding protein [Candidatus Margulisbacteria bacterium]|jgi:predicted AAA+ superfamily ATPase|nr:ATP-binding protein [Candidatus Margulisiibacteriota bacterium]
MDYKPRTISKVILRASANFKLILLTGMRQVGKTTTLLNCGTKKRQHVTLDNPKDLALAQKEPEFFFQTYEPPLLIDEIQHVPSLFPYLKMLADNSPKRGLVWMTGSQQFELMQGISESLAGRVIILNMLGFSLYERAGLGAQQKPFLPSARSSGALNKKNLRQTYKIIWQGAFPDIVDKPANQWAGFYASYVKTYIERDVRRIVNIGNEADFLKFLSVLAARTAQELNLADTARDAGIAPNTAKAWLSILETSGLVYLLKPYFKNISKRFIKRPKLYFMDTGLCAYLTEWNTPEVLEKGAMSGAIFETFVITEIIKSYQHNGLFPALYYYRDNVQTEIDLLLAQNGLLYPIEIKKTANPSRNDISAFEQLAKIGEKPGYGALICLTDRARPLTDKASAISIWDI